MEANFDKYKISPGQVCVPMKVFEKAWEEYLEDAEDQRRLDEESAQDALEQAGQAAAKTEEDDDTDAIALASAALAAQEDAEVTCKNLSLNSPEGVLEYCRNALENNDYEKTAAEQALVDSIAAHQESVGSTAAPSAPPAAQAPSAPPAAQAPSAPPAPAANISPEVAAMMAKMADLIR